MTRVNILNGSAHKPLLRLSGLFFLIPLITVLGLVHLQFWLCSFVLREVWRGDQAFVHEPLPAHCHVLRNEVGFISLRNHQAPPVILNQMATMTIVISAGIRSLISSISATQWIVRTSIRSSSID